jgi:hypothetical protein
MAARAFATASFVQAMVAMICAEHNGLDDGAARPGVFDATTLKQWCDRVLRPQLES